jgi:hypothetical protein
MFLVWSHIHPETLADDARNSEPHMRRTGQGAFFDVSPRYFVLANAQSRSPPTDRKLARITTARKPRPTRLQKETLRLLHQSNRALARAWFTYRLPSMGMFSFPGLYCAT